jgi:hypothetical protein
MQVNEIRETLHDAALVRFPSLPKEEHLTWKIDALSSYLILTAQTRADLYRARLHVHESLHRLREQWIDLRGWEAPARPTNTQIDAAKRRYAPELAAGLAEARHLVDRLTEQISRLEVDDRWASRTYTMLVGG